MERQTRIALITALALAGFAAAVFFHYAQGAYFHMPYPHFTFLFFPGERFSDFFNVLEHAEGLSPYSKPGANYFPFTYIMVQPFTWFHRVVAFKIFVLGFSAFTFTYIYRHLTAATDLSTRVGAAVALSLMTYPFLFTIDRGNFEGLLFILLALYLHFYRKGDRPKSMAFLASAIAMKGYPILFLALPLADRRYREVAWTAGIAAGLTVAGLLLLDGGVGVNLELMLENLRQFKEGYVVQDGGIRFNSNLFSPLKILMGPGLSPVMGFAYTVFALAGMAAVTGWLYLRPLKLWQKVFAITAATILLPEVSFDYKLVHLLLAVALFLEEPAVSRWDAVTCVILGLLLVPKDYWILKEDISISIFINPLLLFGLLGVIASEATSGNKPLPGAARIG